jgi:hypothetical protein
MMGNDTVVVARPNAIAAPPACTQHIHEQCIRLLLMRPVRRFLFFFFVACLSTMISLVLVNIVYTIDSIEEFDQGRYCIAVSSPRSLSIDHILTVLIISAVVSHLGCLALFASYVLETTAVIWWLPIAIVIVAVIVACIAAQDYESLWLVVPYLLGNITTPVTMNAIGPILFGPRHTRALAALALVFWCCTYTDRRLLYAICPEQTSAGDQSFVPYLKTTIQQAAELYAVIKVMPLLATKIMYPLRHTLLASSWTFTVDMDFTKIHAITMATQESKSSLRYFEDIENTTL